ncbi:MAG: hypothetical protein RDU14_15395 [Melioribacteraceae bacterium]|nr:hypothetical protein [Melioribacteraceae bacterium]
MSQAKIEKKNESFTKDDSSTDGKNVIKVNDLQSAKDLVIDALFEYQQGKRTEKECKNIGYLIQVLTTLEKALQDESRINNIIEYGFHKHSNDIAIQFEQFIEIAQKYTDHGKVSKMMQEYWNNRSHVEELTEISREEIFERMKKFTGMDLEKNYLENVENVVEYIKYYFDRIPSEYREKIIQHFKAKGYLKNDFLFDIPDLSE